MAANPYDLVRYQAKPRRHTHPDRLAAVGKLFGFQPAPVVACRVLEIGCSDGGNLIPMAYHLPRSRFVGIDLAAEPVAAGNRVIADLALENIELLPGDLRGIGPEWGEFDYILAHGVYSWVPEEVREALLDVCRARLAPQGIAFVSYNALPGGRLRQMLREMMLHHIRHVQGPAARLRQAREFLQAIGRSCLLSAPWQALRDQEVKALLERDDPGLFHDELAPTNDRFYFHEFAAAARRHGLEYLGEAEPHEMFDPTGALADFPGDIVEREQELDFRKLRRFRQTLLCHAGWPVRREVRPPQMRGFLFSALARQVEDGQIEGLRKVRITPVNEAAPRVALALGEVFPLPLPFEDLIPYAGGESALCEILFALVMSGFADLHVFDFPCQESVSERPRASRLVRYQAARSGAVTSACHFTIELDEVGRRLVSLLDGTRGHAEIAAALEVEDAREFLLPSLEWLASRALLEA